MEESAKSADGTSGTRRTRVLELTRDLYRRLSEHGLFGAAAELSYYLLFSLFPFLVFLVALAAYLPTERAIHTILTRLAAIMPQQALEVIRDNLQNLIAHPRPRLLSVSVLVAVWSASRATSAIIGRLTAAYGVTERRSYLKVQALAIGMTLASALLLFLALAVIVLGGRAGYYLADLLHRDSWYAVLSSGVRWPLGALVAMLIAAVNYYVLPDVKNRPRSVAPGTVVGTLLWLGCTFAFTKYAEHAGSYSATYGSLGGVIMLMTWLYLSGLSFLFGGEVNAAFAALPADAFRRAKIAPRSHR